MESSEQNSMDVRITPEALDDLRSRIGKPRDIKGWNSVAVKDAIWHFTEGMGDDNPLWRDEEYAKKTRWGGIIAPPTFPYTASSYSGVQPAMGLRGVQSLQASDDWEFFRPLFLDDQVICTFELVDVVQKSGDWGLVHQIENFSYRNQENKLVARCQRHCIRGERQRAREKGKYGGEKGMTRYRYTGDEIKAIEADYEREEVRGSAPRYYEDVEVGAEITPVVKGPLTATELVTWVMGWGSPLCKASRIAYKYRRSHPGCTITDPETGIPRFTEDAHWDEQFAKMSGIGGSFDFGPQRASWFAHLLTNWMGDDAFLKKLKVEFRQPNWVGNTLWCKGKVTGKRVEGNLNIVECDLWGETQQKNINTRGHAVIYLPSRAREQVVLPA